MLEVPNDPVSQREVGMARKRRVEKDVERKNPPGRDAVPDLPADTPPGAQHSDALVDDRGLLGDIFLWGPSSISFVLLGKVVGRGRDDQLSARVRELSQEVQRLSGMKRDWSLRIPPAHDLHHSPPCPGE